MAHITAGCNKHFKCYNWKTFKTSQLKQQKIFENKKQKESIIHLSGFHILAVRSLETVAQKEEENKLGLSFAKLR